MRGGRETSFEDPQIRREIPAAGLTRTHVFLWLLTLAGAWLRLSHLGSKSLWLDEGATVALARASWQHFAWVWWHGEANLQTIYFLLMRGWVRFGISEAWLRLPSALFGIASIPLIYVTGRKFMTAGPALAAAALLTFSPTHVEYSQEARSYTLAILLVLLSTYVFVAAVQSGRRRDWVLWTLLGVAVFYTHDFAALVLVAQVCSLVFRKNAPWRPVMLGGAVIFLCALPGITYILRASPENLHFLWMPRPTPKELWHLAMFFGGSGAKIVVSVVLWAAGLITVARSRRSPKHDDFWRAMLIVLWAVVPVVTTALVSLLHPMFLQRYMIFSLPATILLAALGASLLHRGHAAILVVLLCALSLPTIVEGYSKPREDWRAASNAILSSASPGDAVVFFPFYTRIMLDYYRDRYPGHAPALHVFAPGYYSGGDDVRTLLQSLNSNPHQFRHVWLVVAGTNAQPASFDFGDVTTHKLQSIYGTPTIRRFPEITVQEYGR